MLYKPDVITTAVSVKLFSKSRAFFTNYITAPSMEMMPARLSVCLSVCSLPPATNRRTIVFKFDVGYLQVDWTR